MAKEVKTLSRSQIIVHALNYLSDYDTELEKLHDLFLATSPDIAKIKGILVEMLVGFDEYLEG